jgi:hypothetical protein
MFIEQNVKADQSLGALLESVQYYLETVIVVIQKYSEEEKVLPISIEINKKCLDFDMDTVTFNPLPLSKKVKIAKIVPYDKTWLEVMDMV